MKSLKVTVLLAILVITLNIRSAWAIASGLPTDDVYVSFDFPDKNFNEGEDGEALEVWLSSGGGTCQATVITYIQWDLSAIAPEAIIDTATLTLTPTYVLNTSNYFLTLYEVGGNWDETTLTYNTAPPITSTGIETQTAPTVAGQPVVFSSPTLRDYLAAQAVDDDKASFALRFNGCTTYSPAVVFPSKDNPGGGGPYLLLLNPNAVKKSALRISGLDMQWPVVGLLVLGVLGSLARRRRALIEGGFE